MIEFSAPGKLYIAGEYAVMEPGNPAILIAVDQFVTVRIEPAASGSIHSTQYSDLPIHWTRKDSQLVLDMRENPFHYLLAAIHLTEKYALELGKELQFYQLTVESELDSSNGRKYGLGSSGAVTVAAVKALCRFYELPLDLDQLFKLSALAHFSVQKNGSCGDIAASVYGGWLAFRTFDQKWLAAQQHASIHELLTRKWPHLHIEQLKPAADLRLLIGWTGSPASTSELVDQVHAKRTDNLVYQEFLVESNQCVSAMIEGFKNNDLALIQQEIRHNRRLLQQLDAATGVEIETPTLTKLCDLAETYGGAAKSSGAGGGDCGIVILDQKEGVLPLIGAWEAFDILALPLHVYQPKEVPYESQR